MSFFLSTLLLAILCRAFHYNMYCCDAFVVGTDGVVKKIHKHHTDSMLSQSPTISTQTTQLHASSKSKSKSSSYDETLVGEDPYSIATLLLNLVLERRKEQVDKSFNGILRRFKPSYSQNRKRQADQIETLIEQLQQYGGSGKRNSFFSTFGFTPNRKPHHTYDVTQSLLGSGFYCTLYWYTPNMENAPAPLWEALSLKDDNIKGQQYYERNDFEEAVINYSEIWGRLLYITAEGTFQPILSSYDDDFVNESNDGWFQKKSSSQSSSSAPVQNSRRLRTCPDVFRVDATKGTFHVLGGLLQFDLPIQGSSNLVVLYADPRIRIFVSPLESKSAVGNWEEAGLVVVQCRSDLVLGEPVIDMR